LKLKDTSPTDEIFTHIDDTDGHQTTYAVTALVAHLVAWPKVTVPVEKQHADYCVAYRGVEQARLLRLRESIQATQRPIVFIEMPDDTHLLVDGTHRYVLYYLLGIPRIPAYMVPWDVAKEFIIEDIPQTTVEQLMQPSNLVEIRALFGEH
jgi:hypothetical protein